MKTVEDHINFLRKDILGNVEKMYDAGLEKYACLIMAQGIEVLGAYLDDKPMRAKAQSAKRFSLAIYKLFGDKYLHINKRNRLYYQLRANFIHMLLPTNSLKFADNEKLHLSEKDGVILIVPSVLLRDFSRAINKIVSMLQNEALKPKKVSS
jgi:hypothetical protein